MHSTGPSFSLDTLLWEMRMLGLLQSPFDRTLDRRRVELLAQFFLKYFFLTGGNDGGHGILLPVHDDGSCRLVFFYYQVMVQDERAHKYVNANKGSGGAKPCIICQNCVQRNSRFLPDSTGFCVPLTTLDLSQFVPLENNLLRRFVDRLAEAASNGDDQELEDLEIRFGINYCPQGWLADPAFRHIELDKCLLWDWFHTYLEKGSGSERDGCRPGFVESAWLWPLEVSRILAALAMA